MNAYFYLKQKQLYWALRRGIALVGSAGARGEKAYAPTLNQNLFQPLSPKARTEYKSGKGGELTPNEAGVCKMQAVHSSAALTVNLFQYWRDKGRLEPIMKSCDIPGKPNAQLSYESPLRIADAINRKEFPVDPHIDVYINCESFSVAIECKFTEAYSSYKHAGLKPAYMKAEEFWQDIPECKKLAQAISPCDSEFLHLHPAQLLKHILGLMHARKKKDDFCLIYLWYDAPFDDGYEHRREIERFSDIVNADGISFKALTFQEVILRLTEIHWPEHRKYIDYLTERYL